MGLDALSRPVCQFLCYYIIWNLDEFYRCLIVDFIALPVIIEIVQVSILFSTVIRDKLIEGTVHNVQFFTSLSVIEWLRFTIILIPQITCGVMNILSILITENRRVPLPTSAESTHTTTVDEFLYIFTVLIVFYQSFTCTFRIVIPMYIYADHRMIREFVTDSSSGGHDVWLG
jgi:hypothetical protein